MKKILISFLLLLCSVSGVYAASGEGVVTPELAVNEDGYTYYHRIGCSHCADVNSYFEGVEGEENLNIDKFEVGQNPENAKKMSEETKRLGYESAGVPFMVWNHDGEETVLYGSDVIIEHFTPILGEPLESNNKMIVLLILGIIAVILPIILIMGGKNKS